MLPCFVLQEITIREPGESTALDLGVDFPCNLALTLGITHAVERADIHLDILGSTDGVRWSAKPLVSFPAKNYCGNYEAVCFDNPYRYVKAVWRVNTFRSGAKPLFELSLRVEAAKLRAMAGAA